jgi:hypothetical protein
VGKRVTVGERILVPPPHLRVHRLHSVQPSYKQSVVPADPAFDWTVDASTFSAESSRCTEFIGGGGAGVGATTEALAAEATGVGALHFLVFSGQVPSDSALKQ